MSEKPSQSRFARQLSQRESPWQQGSFAKGSQKSEKNHNFAKASPSGRGGSP